MRFAGFFALLVALPLVYGAGVIEAYDNDFESKVFGKPGKYSLVNFYGSGCEHCAEFRPHWEPLGELYNNTKLQVIQIDGAQNSRVRKRYTIVAFPTIKLYSSDGETVAAFSSSERTTENLIKFINDYTGIKPNEFKTNVKYISTLDEFKKLEKSDKVILFTAPWVSELQNRYNNYFHFMAKRHTDMDFVMVDTSIPELSELSTTFRIDSVPTVIYEKDFSYQKLASVTFEKLRSLFRGEDTDAVDFQINSDSAEGVQDWEEDEELSWDEVRKLREL